MNLRDLKRTVFWKSKIRSFRKIKVNCFYRFWFLAEVSKKFLKRHYFVQFKGHNSGRKKEIRQMTPLFSSTFCFLTICDIHFCIWKFSKFIFMGWPFLSILVCKISEFWRWKLWDQNFLLFDSGNIHIKETKKPGLTFAIELRPKFVWSHGLIFI